MNQPTIPDIQITNNGTKAVNLVITNQSTVTNFTVIYSAKTGNWDWLDRARRLRAKMPLTPDSTDLLRKMRDGLT